jgi:4-hydroxy-tetrahydrodipicolinate synthase
MKYEKKNAKEYARNNMKGVYAASVTPFKDDFSLDEEGYRKNCRHWFDDLQIAGLFTCGKQGEYFSMSVAERKRVMEITIEEARGEQPVVMSCSDTNLDVVLDLAFHAQKKGADYVIVHSPTLHFGADTDATIYEYYRYLSERLDIGIALWNHPICGYTMSPKLCAAIADFDNIVAIKYSAPRNDYIELTQLAGDRILVSNPSEEDWLDNIVELGWQLYLCSSPPILLQSKNDTRIHDYTQLAFSGKTEQARQIRDSLEPARKAFARSRLGTGPTPATKVWQECLGQVGGRVRRPLLNLDSAERAQVEAEFRASGIQL